MDEQQIPEQRDESAGEPRPAAPAIESGQPTLPLQRHAAWSVALAANA